jgi:hypothetical protein
MESSPRNIHHAVRQAAVVEEIGDDPTRYLVLGPDRPRSLLELVVIDRPQGPADRNDDNDVRASGRFHRRRRIEVRRAQVP